MKTILIFCFCLIFNFSFSQNDTTFLKNEINKGYVLSSVEMDSIFAGIKKLAPNSEVEILRLSTKDTSDLSNDITSALTDIIEKNGFLLGVIINSKSYNSITSYLLEQEVNKSLISIKPSKLFRKGDYVDFQYVVLPEFLHKD